MIGTSESDQSCWLAEARKIPSLEGLWIYGVTVSTDRSDWATVTIPYLAGVTRRPQRFAHMPLEPDVESTERPVRRRRCMRSVYGWSQLPL